MSEETKPEETKKSGPGVLTLVKAIAFVTAIVAVECVAASMFLPTEEETTAAAKKIAAAKAGLADDGTSEDGDETPLENVHEVSLGKYYVTSYQPESNTTLRIDFDLFATVLAEEEEEFKRLYDQNQHRLSEQVHVTFREAELTDLTDSGLGLIKRRILEKSNRTLGRPLLREVIFSQFSFIEQ